MKRTKAFFLTILAVMGLCSCGESSEVKPVKLAEDYKTPAEFTIDGTEYVASFIREGADMWECEITAPETVSGSHCDSGAFGYVPSVSFVGQTLVFKSCAFS